MIGVRRLRAVAIMLAAAIVTITMWTSPPSARAAGVQCLRQAAVPSAPAGAIVLARSLSSTASGPNVVVIPVGSSWTPTTCPASAIVAAPTTISVGSGAALVFQGPNFPNSYTNTWVTSWGAVDVTPSDPAPDIDPGGPSPWKPTEVDAITPQASLNSYQSCRACDLHGVSYDDRVLNIPGAAQSFLGDVSGANLTGAHLGGSDNPLYIMFDFDDANLTNAHLEDAFFDMTSFHGTIVSGTTFDGSALLGVQLSGLRYQSPPSFNNIAVGNGSETTGGVLCTTFQDTSLLGASFSLKRPNDPECANQPLFPGSTVPMSWIPKLESQRIDFGQAQYVSSGGQALAGANLQSIDLDGASFIGTPPDLEKTNFSGASLAHTSFRLADLAGAQFANAAAPGAVFADANLEGATFAGPKSTLTGANFVRADLSGASFQSADISRAAFDGALAAGTDFNSVLAANTVFSDAHIYGDGQAFEGARSLAGADFSGAVLAADGSVGGSFNFTDVPLNGAKFDGTQCIACNFTGSTLANVVFSRAYLPGVVFSGAQNFSGVDMTGAWLYCGDLQNGSCAQDSSGPTHWDWPLALGVGETFGDVPFANTDLTGVSLQDVTACPDGLPPSGSGGCAGHLLPAASNSPPIPADCSAAGHYACPTLTTTRLHLPPASPLAVTAATPATWSTTLSQPGFDVAMDDGTIRLFGAGPAQVIAGQPGVHCSDPTMACGDGGSAGAALLGAPTGLAVGLDGSLYVADPKLHRLRVITPAASQQACRSARARHRGVRVRTGCLQRLARTALSGASITTIAGSGDACTSIAPQACGAGGPADQAALAGPYDVWVSPVGNEFIADGPRGIREIRADGTIASVGPPPGKYDVRGVAGDGRGNLFVTTHDPDYLLEINLTSGQSTIVVGTGTSGYNGNQDPNYGTLLPGNEVQVDDPQAPSVDLDGNVVFADTGNNLIRAYAPSSGHVIDDLAGQVSSDGTPQGGDNGDGHYAQETELLHPAGVAVTTGPLLIAADTGNQKVRQLGPGPINAELRRGAPQPLVRLNCTRTARRRPRKPAARCTLTAIRKAARLPRLGAPKVTLARHRRVYATGRGARPQARHFRLLIRERRRIARGRYMLNIGRPGTHKHFRRVVIIELGHHHRRPRRHHHRHRPPRFTGAR